MKKLLITLNILCSATIITCSTDETPFLKDQNVLLLVDNTAHAYISFIKSMKDHPYSVYIPESENHLDLLRETMLREHRNADSQLNSLLLWQEKYSDLKGVKVSVFEKTYPNEAQRFYAYPNFLNTIEGYLARNEASLKDQITRETIENKEMSHKLVGQLIEGIGKYDYENTQFQIKKLRAYSLFFEKVLTLIKQESTDT